MLPKVVAVEVVAAVVAGVLVAVAVAVAQVTSHPQRRLIVLVLSSVNMDTLEPTNTT